MQPSNFLQVPTALIDDIQAHHPDFSPRTNLEAWERIHIRLINAGEIPVVDIGIFKEVLTTGSEISIIRLLQIPSLRKILAQSIVKDYPTTRIMRSKYIREIAYALNDELNKLQRLTKNLIIRDLCYGFLIFSNPYMDQIATQICLNSFSHPNEKKSALSALINKGELNTLNILLKEAGTTKKIYYNWFLVQVKSDGLTVEKFKEIISHPNMIAFLQLNPLYVEGVYSAFIDNLGCYHEESGKGYELIVDYLINNRNSAIEQKAFEDYASLPPMLQGLMKAQIDRLKYARESAQ